MTCTLTQHSTGTLHGLTPVVADRMPIRAERVGCAYPTTVHQAVSWCARGCPNSVNSWNVLGSQYVNMAWHDERCDIIWRVEMYHNMTWVTSRTMKWDDMTYKQHQHPCSLAGNGACPGSRDLTGYMREFGTENRPHTKPVFTVP